MGLGGNPYGPAGTGKTESVKALGALFGRQVLVFNCDEVSPFFFQDFSHTKLILIFNQPQYINRSYAAIMREIFNM